MNSNSLKKYFLESFLNYFCQKISLEKIPDIFSGRCQRLRTNMFEDCIKYFGRTNNIQQLSDFKIKI
jgi:hypothetical protein